VRSGTGSVTADNQVAGISTVPGTPAELVNKTGATFTLTQTVLAAELTINTIYAASIYIRPNSSTTTTLVLTSGTLSLTMNITWASGVPTFTTATGGSPSYTNAYFVPADNSYYRFTLAMISSGTAGAITFAISAATGAATGSVWAWGAQFEEGSYSTSYLSIGTSDPLAANHKTIASWLAATNSSTTGIEIGVLKNGTHRVNASTLTWSGLAGTVSATHYRHLQGESTYNPYTNSGPKLIVEWSNTANDKGFDINENFARISGIGIFGSFHKRFTAATTDTIGNRLINVRSCNNVKIYNCYLAAWHGGDVASTTGSHPLDGALSIESTGATSAQNGRGDSQVRLQSSIAGTLTVGDWITITNVGGIYQVQASVTFTANQIQNVSISPPLFADAADEDAVDPSKGQYTYTGIVFQGISGNISTNNWVYNTIIQGSGTAYGLSAGILWGDFGGGGGCYNCTLYNIKALGGYGFFRPYTAQTAPSLVNNIAIDCGSNFSGVFDATFKNNVTGSNIVAGTNYVSVNATAQGTFLDHNSRDFRLRFGSPALETGSNESTQFLGSTGPGADSDFAGTDRPDTGAAGNWDVGAYQGATLPLNTSTTTTITSTIGRFKQYESLSVWLADKVPASLYSANEIHIAEVYSDAEFSAGKTCYIDYFNHVTNSVHNITIRAATDHRYTPFDGRGVSFKYAGNYLGATADRAVFWISCDWIRLEGFRIDQTATSAVTDRNPGGIELFANNCELDSLFVRYAGTAARPIGACIEVAGNFNQLTNCIAKGSSSGNTGATRGIQITPGCLNTNVLHCIIHSIRGNVASAYGLLLQLSSYKTRVSGCVSIATTNTVTGPDVDFQNNSGEADNLLFDHCASGDTSATGTGSLTSQSVSTLFRDAAADDFRLPSSSPLLNVGSLGLGTFFSTDITGNRRYAPYDIGVYEGLFYSPLLVTPKPQEAARWATCWEIVRRDGVAYFFTDCSEALVHAGQTYLPISGVQDTATRVEAGLKESNTEIAGAITSNYIQVNHLGGGYFRGARVRKFLLDWRFPWTVPYKEWQFTVGQITFDSEKWNAELLGPAAKLEQRVGEVITVSCPYVLGDEDCTKDIRPLTNYNIAVSTVDNGTPRKKFTATTLNPAIAADDYFGKGRVLWLTGSNAGLVGEVKFYTNSTKTIELAFAMPNAIAVNDTFVITPGCRKRLKLDCRDKFNNAVNFGGRAFMPSTDKTLDTPTR
jgi:uncharacterized phage protein (TIGR02218 family)